tara:strand:+ start:680 stop:895 length:216 start_codon:yes stop_codon:yes gene_type:complete
MKMEKYKQIEEKPEVKLVLPKPPAPKIKAKADKMLTDLAAALASDPRLRKVMESTEINRKFFDVDFTKVDA